MDDNRQEKELWQECPVCNGTGNTCGATDHTENCGESCCEECKDSEEFGCISTVRYVELANYKLEARRREGWVK